MVSYLCTRSPSSADLLHFFQTQPVASLMDCMLRGLACGTFFNVRVPPRFLVRLGDLVKENSLSRETHLAVVRHDLKSHIVLGLGVSLRTVVQVQGEQAFTMSHSPH